MTDFEPQLLGRMRPWTSRLGTVVDARTRDAAAHASSALEGDPRAVLRSPGLKEAKLRLAELRGVATSLVMDAREDFYAHAFQLWNPVLDPAYYRTTAGPTLEGRRAARTAIIHATTLPDELAGPLDEAARTLSQAAALAARREGGRPVEAWRSRTADRLKLRLAGVLSDSQTALLWGVLQALEK